MDYTVSVIVPAYNAEDFILKAIGSVLAQSYSNIQLIVIDDCSTDGTLALLKELDDDRITLISNNTNLGVVESRNLAIDMCIGKYIAFLDADDYWIEDKLEAQLKAMNRYGAAFSCTSYTKYTESGKVKNTILVDGWLTRSKILVANTIGCSTVLYDVSLLGKRYFKKLKYNEDLALWLEILEECDCLGIAESKMNYLVRDVSRSSDKISVALFQWSFYRDDLHIGIVRRIYIYFLYCLKGLFRQ